MVNKRREGQGQQAVLLGMPTLRYNLVQTIAIVSGAIVITAPALAGRLIRNFAMASASTRFGTTPIAAAAITSVLQKHRVVQTVPVSATLSRASQAQAERPGKKQEEPEVRATSVRISPLFNRVATDMRRAFGIAANPTVVGLTMYLAG